MLRNTAQPKDTNLSSDLRFLTHPPSFPRIPKTNIDAIYSKECSRIDDRCPKYINLSKLRFVPKLRFVHRHRFIHTHLINANH